MSYRIQCTKDIESLPPRGRIDEESLKAPKEAEKWLEYKMGCINEIDVLAAVLGILQDWLQGTVNKGFLLFSLIVIEFSGDASCFFRLRPIERRKLRTWVIVNDIVVSRSISTAASFKVRGGCSKKCAMSCAR